MPQQPTAVAAIIPYRPDFIDPQESLLRLSANSRRRACAESVKGTVAGRNERTAVGECTRCRDFSVQATTTLERTRFACIPSFVPASVRSTDDRFPWNVRAEFRWNLFGACHFPSEFGDEIFRDNGSPVALRSVFSP
jgi:hypothetical protein